MQRYNTNMKESILQKSKSLMEIQFFAIIKDSCGIGRYMKERLIICKLKIKSSYNQNIELPADSSFDTLQFFANEKTIDETIAFLITSTKEHYGDIIEKTVDIAIENPTDYAAIKTQLTKEGLTPYLDTTPDFLFWNPDNQKYRTQSKPL